LIIIKDFSNVNGPPEKKNGDKRTVNGHKMNRRVDKWTIFYLQNHKKYSIVNFQGE